MSNTIKHFERLILAACIVIIVIACTPAVQSTIAPNNTTIPITFIPTSTTDPISSPTLASVVTQNPAITMTPSGDGTEKIIFAYFRKNGFEKTFPKLQGELNVFIANWDGTGLAPVTDGLNDYNYIQSVSPDGRKVLIASLMNSFTETGDLYVVSLDDKKIPPLKLASDIYQFSGSAIWLDNSIIAFIAKDGNKRVIFSVKSDGSELRPISKEVPGATPIRLLPSIDKTHVYWHGGAKGMSAKGIWWSAIDGSSQGSVLATASWSVGISPDGTKIIWAQNNNTITIANLPNLDNTRVINFSRNLFDIIWSKDSSKVFLSARYNVPRSYAILSLKDFALFELNFPGEYDENTDFLVHDWSSDGKQLLVSVFEPHRSQTKIFNLETMTFSDEFSKRINPDSIENEPTSGVYWLPAPK